MGTGTSRGKKVAPVCEINVTKTGIGVAGKQGKSPIKHLQIRTVLRNARNRAQPDCRSHAHESDLSAEDRDNSSGRKTPKRAFIRSKSYGLCHFSQEDPEDEVSPAVPSEEPRVLHSDVNNRDNMEKPTTGDLTHLDPSSLTCLGSRSLLESLSTSEKQLAFDSRLGSSLTTPVTLFDGSEEELMDTIEREFSRPLN